MRAELTPRQTEILRYIADMIRQRGYPPSITEIGNRFDISSTNGVSDHLKVLERKGYIHRESNRARSIRLTDSALRVLLPDSTEPAVESVGWPHLGRIAAGFPVEAMEQRAESWLTPPETSRGHRGFCLTVTGDSMVDAGIWDGDIVFVDRDIAPRTGDVVAALVDGEMTLKRYFPWGRVVELRPENRHMSTLLYPADAVSIQGVVVWLARRIR
ncbi:MAG TPA: transcriptional repressor LexA [Candidatus Hydrogenedentes bacterium]|nr:transcriptional repressor LexA [Candidatus Hydrogenedentota bacterium]HPU96523.1 transcriptional repressor LexA [Candidatus Hydrogenedentota bacterium]